MTSVIVGIDVSKSKVDVAVAGNGTVREWGNDEQGRRVLSGWLSEQGVELVVLEASGGIEAGLVNAKVAPITPPTRRPAPSTSSSSHAERTMVTGGTSTKP